MATTVRRIEDGWELVRDKTSASARRFVDLVRDHPLPALTVGLGLGVLIGVAFPATRREDRLLGETRDGFLGSARAAGREAIDKSKEAARDAVERVRESVREQELTPGQLAEKARHVARDAAETLRDAERQVVQGVVGGAPVTPPEPTGTPPRL